MYAIKFARMFLILSISQAFTNVVLAQQSASVLPELRGTTLICPEGRFNVNTQGSNTTAAFMSERYGTRRDLDPAQLIFQGATSDLTRYSAWLQIDGLIDAASEKQVESASSFSAKWTDAYQPLRVYLFKFDPAKVSDAVLPSLVQGLIDRDEDFISNRSADSSVSVQLTDAYGIIVNFNEKPPLNFYVSSGSLLARVNVDGVEISEIKKDGYHYARVTCSGDHLQGRMFYRLIATGGVNEFGETLPARHYLLLVQVKFPLS